MPSRSFDVVIAGAGPAGLAAGLASVRGGLKTLLLEKHAAIGQPLNCAEGVPARSFEEVLPLRKEWIKNRINRGLLFAPSGKCCDLPYRNAGYVIDRPRMEQDLAEDFTAAGGELRLNCRAVRLRGKADRFDALEAVDDGGRGTLFRARVFIAADGVESSIARLAGIDNRLDIYETDSLLQYHLTGVEVDPETVEIYLGNQVAPKSYAWVFPQGKSEANVGLGVASIKNENPDAVTYLERFIEKRFGMAAVTRKACGTCPLYRGPDKLARGNLLVVGDAARVLDSLSGAGIINALYSGKTAGEAAAAYLAGEGDDPAVLHRIYPERFLRERDRELEMYYKLKKVLVKLTDYDLNDIVEVLDEYFAQKEQKPFNAIKIILNALTKRPRLLKLARHLF